MKEQIRIILIATICIMVLVNGCSKPEKSGPLVLFDQSHGQQFLINKNRPLDLSELAELFDKANFDVQASKKAITDASLKDVDLLVVSGPFAPFTEKEIQAITTYLENGGHLCIMLHIASPPAPLLKQLGVAISNGSIREQTNILGDNPLNFKITSIEQHPLTEGLTSFNVYGCWALLNIGDNTKVVAKTSPQSWVDLNLDKQLSPGDAVRSLGVIVAGSFGKGKFVVFGDDAIFQNQFLIEENKLLAKNLVRWMKGENTRVGEEQRTKASTDTPHKLAKDA